MEKSTLLYYNTEVNNSKKYKEIDIPYPQASGFGFRAKASGLYPSVARWGKQKFWVNFMWWN